MDYYNILDVPRNASPEEIKKAYKKKAMKNHPDRGGDEKAFQQISEAYDTLSNPEKKAMYDQFGTSDPQQMGGMGGMGGHPFGDMFDQMFRQNGFGNFGFGQQQRRRKSRDIQTTQEITLEEVLVGKRVDLKYKISSGKTESITLDIPIGIGDGQTVRYQGYGDDGIPGARGDLLIKVRIKPHHIWKRDRWDLYRSVNVSVIDLMIGTTLELQMLNKRTITLTIPPGTDPGRRFSVPGYGIPDSRSGRTGKAIIEIVATTPTVKDSNIINKLREIKDAIS